MSTYIIIYIAWQLYVALCTNSLSVGYHSQDLKVNWNFSYCADSIVLNVCDPDGLPCSHQWSSNRWHLHDPPQHHRQPWGQLAWDCGTVVPGPTDRQVLPRRGCPQPGLWHHTSIWGMHVHVWTNNVTKNSLYIRTYMPYKNQSDL